MELNYEKRYAYAEVDCILKWLGESYINRIPKKVLQTIREEKKFAYRPELDFSKPLEDQVRQETKDIIAYLNYTYWTTDKEEKKKIEDIVNQNAKKEKEKNKSARMKEVQRRANMIGNTTVTASIDRALRDNLNNN